MRVVSHRPNGGCSRDVGATSELVAVHPESVLVGDDATGRLDDHPGDGTDDRLHPVAGGQIDGGRRPGAAPPPRARAGSTGCARWREARWMGAAARRPGPSHAVDAHRISWVTNGLPARGSRPPAGSRSRPTCTRISTAPSPPWEPS